MSKFLYVLLACFLFCFPTQADETAVITTANVNVRSGPGIEYEVLDTYRTGTKVTPGGIVKDGWRQVKYKDGYAWMSSRYLSSPITIPEESEEPDELHRIYDNYGTDGRLIIPELGINVALYSCNPDEDINYAQYIVDCEDSADYYTRNGTIIIGDHKNQGFSGLYDAYVGEYAYILHSDGSVTKLVCERKTDHGTNSGPLYDEYGNMASMCSQPLMMYTCNPAGWWDITIVYWNYA